VVGDRRQRRVRAVDGEHVAGVGAIVGLERHKRKRRAAVAGVAVGPRVQRLVVFVIDF
jgi:hypothetical protein